MSFPSLLSKLVVTASLLAVSHVTAAASPVSIADLVEGNPDFSILDRALNVTGLKPALRKVEGMSLTVFAPTDAAFGALPSSVLDRLFEDREQLSSILLYHVLGRKLDAASLTAAASGRHARFDTLLGKPVRVERSFLGTLEVEGATVQAADLVASNGIVHVVGKVLIPPALVFGSQSVEDIVRSSGQFSTLLTALQRASLLDRLGDAGPITLFAPTNAAFTRISPSDLQAILADLPRLQRLLKKHLANVRVPALSALVRVEVNGLQYPVAPIATLSGDSLTVAFGNPRSQYIDTVYVERGLVLSVIRATNGSVVVVDRVL